MAEQNREQDPPRDLLGDPIDIGRAHWGRPSFGKTEEKQRLVIALAAAKWTQDRIARQIGCDVKTLRKHFSRELTEAADMLEAAALKQLMDALCQGKAGAVNRALAMAADARAIPPPPRGGTQGAEPEDDADKPEAPMGKKATLEAAAQKPGPSWGNLLKH